MSCIFCDIINNELPAEIIYQDELVICFLDLHPINHGHLLIATKMHYPDLPEMPDNVAAHVMLISKKLTIRLQEILYPDGVTIMQNNGHYNEIGHYHMHLVPRYANDRFQWIYLELERTENKLKEMANKLKL